MVSSGSCCSSLLVVQTGALSSLVRTVDRCFCVHLNTVCSNGSHCDVLGAVSRVERDEATCFAFFATLSDEGSGVVGVDRNPRSVTYRGGVTVFLSVGLRRAVQEVGVFSLLCIVSQACWNHDIRYVAFPCVEQMLRPDESDIGRIPSSWWTATVTNVLAVDRVSDKKMMGGILSIFEYYADFGIFFCTEST